MVVSQKRKYMNSNTKTLKKINIKKFKTRKAQFSKLIKGGKRTVKTRKIQSGYGLFTSRKDSELNKKLKQDYLDIVKYYTDKTQTLINAKDGLNKYKYEVGLIFAE